MADLESKISPEKASAQPQPHHSSLLNDFEELGKAAFNSGIEKPLNGLGQLISAGHLPEMHIWEPDPNATGVEKWFQTAGSAAGTIADFAVLTAVAATGVGALAEIPAVGGALASVGSVVGGTAAAESLATSALTGIVYGGALTPLAPGESQWDRVGNAATMGTTFLALGGLSNLLGVTGTSVVGTIARKGLASAGAGFVNANMQSLTTGHGLATEADMTRSVISWGLTGAAMGAASETLKAGSNWLSGKFAPPDTDDGVRAVLSSGRVDGPTSDPKWQTGPDGKPQLTGVRLGDGTQLVREGTTNQWIANPDAKTPVTWSGDVSLKADGTPNFEYVYEKAASHASLSVQLSDGSKLAAVGPNGGLSLPDATLQTASQRLPDAALSSIKALGLNVPIDRLQLQGVSTDGVVQTQYSLNATPAETAQLLKAVGNNPSFKIVSADHPLVPPAALAPTSITTSITPSLAENQAGSYQYSEPMPDHTSTVSFLFQGDDGSWKTLTGLRERPPFAGKEVLPGGFLDMKGSTIEDPAHAAAREVAEETGLKISNPELIRIGDSLDRDVRNRVIDFQYAAFGTSQDLATMNPLDDLTDLKVRDVQQLLSDPNSLAFDHYQVLEAAYKLALSKQAAAAATTGLMRSGVR